MGIKLVILVVMFILFLISFVLRRRGLRRTEKKIRDKRKINIKEVSRFKRFIKKTKDENLIGWGEWLLVQFYFKSLENKGKALRLSEDIKKRYKNFPFYEENLFILGNLYLFELFDYTKAVKIYQQLLDEYPQSKWTIVAQERIKLIEDSINEKNILNKYVLAEKYFEKGENKKTVETLEELIKTYPSSKLVQDSYYFLGDIFYFRLNNSETAIIFYKKLIKTFPKGKSSPNAQYKIGECLRGLKRWKEAIDAYKRFILDYKNEVYTDYAQFYIAQCYEEMEDWRMAKVSYNLILGNHPGSIWTDIAYTRANEILKRMK